MSSLVRMNPGWSRRTCGVKLVRAVLAAKSAWNRRLVARSRTGSESDRTVASSAPSITTLVAVRGMRAQPRSASMPPPRSTRSEAASATAPYGYAALRAPMPSATHAKMTSARSKLRPKSGRSKNSRTTATLDRRIAADRPSSGSVVVALTQSTGTAAPAIIHRRAPNVVREARRGTRTDPRASRASPSGQ